MMLATLKAAIEVLQVPAWEPDKRVVIRLEDFFARELNCRTYTAAIAVVPGVGLTQQQFNDTASQVGHLFDDVAFGGTNLALFDELKAGLEALGTVTVTQDGDDVLITTKDSGVTLGFGLFSGDVVYEAQIVDALSAAVGAGARRVRRRVACA